MKTDPAIPVGVARVRVMVVEDQGLVRGFYVRWLQGLSRYAVAGAARSGEEALNLLMSEQPDIVIVDLQLPGIDGLEFVRAARQLRPQLRALVVSSLIDPLALTRVRESGVEGYTEKDATPELLEEALNAVASGRQYFSQKFEQTLSNESSKAEAVGKILSRREQQVLELVVAKHANREIAEIMGLSVRTVEFHRANLMAKLGATNYDELLVAARLRGWTG